MKKLYPQWETLSYTAQRCSTCEAGKDVQKEERIRSEQEKASSLTIVPLFTAAVLTPRMATSIVHQMKLKHMYENALGPNNTRLLQDVPCALVPADFARTWKQYIYRPMKYPRPEILDTTCFVCEHGKLNIDPNSNDLDSTICVVRRDDWDALAEMYVVTI